MPSCYAFLVCALSLSHVDLFCMGWRLATATVWGTEDHVWSVSLLGMGLSSPCWTAWTADASPRRAALLLLCDYCFMPLLAAAALLLLCDYCFMPLLAALRCCCCVTIVLFSAFLHTRVSVAHASLELTETPLPPSFKRQDRRH